MQCFKMQVRRYAQALVIVAQAFVIITQPFVINAKTSAIISQLRAGIFFVFTCTALAN